MSTVFLIIAEATLGVMYASNMEWLLHRHVMHRPLWKLKYPFEAHALTHHRIFGYDATYHLQHEKDKRTIPMAWWNWIVIVSLAAIPPFLASLLSGLWSIVVVFSIVTATYYGVYEYIHWCMHLPKPDKRRIVERFRLFYLLNGHHLLHHRYMGKNFNVVCPAADYMWGTLLVRSKMRFDQPVGPTIPDVQPIEAEKPPKEVCAV